MKILGSVTELLSSIFKKNSQDITVRPNQATTYTAARDVQLPVGDADHVIISADSAATMTNKSFDADGTGNALTNVEDANIKAAAAIDATKIHDGSVTNTEFGYINSLTSDAQTQISSKQADVITTTGDTIIGVGGVATRLAPGSTGQVLTTTDGSGTVSWTAPAGTGDVTAAAAFAIDEKLVTSDGTAKGVKASGVTVSGSALSSITTLATSGFIGMGRTPLTELDIYAASGSNYMNFDTSGTTTQDRGIRFRWSGSSIAEGTNKFEMKHRGSTDDLYFGSNNAADIMVMESGGDIGIGAAGPASKLHVTSADAANAAVRITNTSTTAASKGLIIQTGNVDTVIPLVIERSGVGTLVQVMGDGKVGIGITPTTPLHVHAPGSTGIKLTRQGFGSSGSNIDLSGNNLLISNIENGSTEFFNNGNLNMKLLNNTTVNTGYNAAAAIMHISKETATNRSINAAGTVNVSGADYAEYMTKATPSDVIQKGEVCGVNSSGLLTKNWSESISFVIKSTDPSYVGGDAWFTQKPEEFGSQEEFETARETARGAVDRIAFCGQVPVICTDTSLISAGDYLIAEEGTSDTIKVTAYTPANMTLPLLLKQVGQVWIITDGTTVSAAVGKF